MTYLWPNKTQTLLLKAAMGDGVDAIAAFEAWKASVDFSRHLDPGSFRMLPQLHHNLKRIGHDDPLMQTLAGTFRYTWVQIQKLHDDSARMIDLFDAADVPVMLNKGIALGLCHYDHPAHRPMSDVDLMVPRERVGDAAAVLERAGWRVWHAGREIISWRDIVDYRHSVGLRDAAGNEIDLHWAPSPELRGPSVLRAFWDGAQPMIVRGRTALRPSATCMLIHAALHGVRYNAMPPLRWIVDFAMVLRGQEGDAAHTDPVDWDAMTRMAGETRTSARLAMALTYLRDVMDMSIPAEVIERLHRDRYGFAERIEDWNALTDPSRSRVHRMMGRTNSVARVVADGKGLRLPGMAARWIVREWRNGAARRNARLR